MSLNSFLSEIALANLNIEIREQKEKVWRLESSIRWEQSKQKRMSTLSVMLERAQLTRKELNFVLSGVKDATPDELLEKMQFVSERITENDPAKQFSNKCDVFAESIEGLDKNFERELVIKANKCKKLY